MILIRAIPTLTFKVLCGQYGYYVLPALVSARRAADGHAPTRGAPGRPSVSWLLSTVADGEGCREGSSTSSHPGINYIESMRRA